MEGKIPPKLSSFPLPHKKKLQMNPELGESQDVQSGNFLGEERCLHTIQE